ncbi:MAG: hypothetical protein JJ979_02405 [Roseibium sp.]|nr:hypothetical protein [Roseibium sp.]
MLEEQIANLADRVAAVEGQIGETNKLLVEILETLRGGGVTPSEASATKAKPQKTKAVSEKPKKADNTNEPAPDTVEKFAEEAEAASYDIDDVRSAFLKAKEEVGKETAIGAITDITGPIKNISHVPKDKFADVVAALVELAKQEAA